MRRPAYTLTPPDLPTPLRPEMLALDGDAPFLPGRQPAGALLPFLDCQTLWEPPPYRPYPPPRRTPSRISRPFAAAACVAALVVIALAASLPSIHASQPTPLAEIAAPATVTPPPARAAIPPASVRVAIAATPPQPAAEAVPDRLELAIKPLQAKRAPRPHPLLIRTAGHPPARTFSRAPRFVIDYVDGAKR